MKKKASNAEILKQVLYEMLTLAYCIEFLAKNKWTRGHSHIDSSEPIQTTAMLKICLLYDFFYTPNENNVSEAYNDFYSAKNDFNIVLPRPTLSGCGPKGMFSRESVNKYIVHLTEERITKPKELPPPKFKGAPESIIKNSALILSGAEIFINGLVKQSFMNLNQESEHYLKDLRQTISRLNEVPLFRDSYNPAPIAPAKK